MADDCDTLKRRTGVGLTLSHELGEEIAKAAREYKDLDRKLQMLPSVIPDDAERKVQADLMKADMEELRTHIDFLSDRKNDVDRQLKGLKVQLQEYADARRPSFREELKARRDPLLKEADAFVDSMKGEHNP